MKYIIVLVLVICVFAGTAKATEKDFLGKEPHVSELGAPPYPGAVFIRAMPSWDPYFETVLYVSSDTVGNVKNFFSREFPDVRVVQYSEENVWVWVFLLNEWIELPDEPSRDDLTILDASPNILVKKFQRILFEPLLELFETRPDAREKLEALKNARTIIRYTFQKIEEDFSFQKIVGKWKNVDRDLFDYNGSVLQFNPDSTYTFSLTPDNIAYQVKKLHSAKNIKNTNSVDLKKYIEGQNPEKGKFSIMRNSITMETDSPVVGGKVKSGLAEISSVTLSLQFINTPRLTYIREMSE